MPTTPDQSVLLAGVTTASSPHQTGLPSWGPHIIWALHLPWLGLRDGNALLFWVPGKNVWRIFGCGDTIWLRNRLEHTLIRVWQDSMDPGCSSSPCPWHWQKMQEDFCMGTWRSPFQALLQRRPAPKPEQDAQSLAEHLPGWRCHHLS